MLSLSGKAFSQPFVDLVSFNYQRFSGDYKANPNWKNTTENYSLGLFLPKELKNGNVLLMRINSEKIHSAIMSDVDYSSDLSSISLAVGFQLVSKNKKWKTKQKSWFVAMKKQVNADLVIWMNG